MNTYKLKIVIIDSGVDLSADLFRKSEINGIYFYRNQDDYICNSHDIADKLGHGTAVCGIIKQYGLFTELYIVKIYNENYCIDEGLLIYALEFIEENIECDIINLSLGIMNPSRKLMNICKKINKKNIIMISAFDNTGAISYPAAYKEVIGVDMSQNCTHANDFIYVKNGKVNLYAKGTNTRLLWLNNTFVINRGASYATAFATAIISRCLYEGKIKNSKRRFLEKYLCENSKKNYIYNKSVTISKNYFVKNIKRAAIFPVNKEVHSLINFSSLLKFHLIDIYDIPQHGYVNKKIYSLDHSKEFLVKNIYNIDYEAIDTLIISHLSEISQLLKRNIKSYIISKCLENGVKCYCFDDQMIEESFHNYKKNIWTPVRIKKNCVENKAGKLYGIKTPILGIFGTSSNQGKYTLQLQLRDLFLKQHYKVGQLSTEPSGLLFGMDEIMPFGYNSVIDVSDTDLIEITNFMLHRIDKKNKDIIIVGCQSGTIPKMLYNISDANIKQINFLLGSNPDVVILCVNLFDDINYIKRTIITIENIVECVVPVLAVSPLYFPDEWNLVNNKKKIADRIMIEEFRIQIKKSIGLDLFVIGTDEISDLYEVCIQNLSE